MKRPSELLREVRKRQKKGEAKKGDIASQEKAQVLSRRLLAATRSALVCGVNQVAREVETLRVIVVFQQSAAVTVYLRNVAARAKVPVVTLTEDDSRPVKHAFNFKRLTVIGIRRQQNDDDKPYEDLCAFLFGLIVT